METKPSLSRDQRMQANADKLEEVKIKQINGEIEKTPANIDSDYEIDKNDEAYVHIEVRKKHKQPGDAEDLIEKRVIKLHPELMKPSEDSGMFKQYSSFKIVHDPRKVVLKNQEGEAISGSEEVHSEAPKTKKGKA